LGNKEEVLNCSIIMEGGGEYLVVKLSVSQNVQGWKKILCPS